MPTYTATLNRFEVKYLVPTRTIPELTADLAEFTVPDPHAGAEGYGVFTVYWDSPDWAFFWEKIEGLKYRRKLRFRRYLGGEPKVFIEIKQREDRTLQKRRLEWPLAQVLETFTPGATGDWDRVSEDPVATEVLLMIHRLRLAPRMAILYRRRALFGAFDPELRLTFDSRLQYSAADLDIARPWDTGKSIMDPRVSVLEVKYNHRAPVWLTKLARSRELNVVRMSKFCTAVDKEFFGHQLT